MALSWVLCPLATRLTALIVYTCDPPSPDDEDDIDALQEMSSTTPPAPTGPSARQLQPPPARPPPIPEDHPSETDQTFPYPPSSCPESSDIPRSSPKRATFTPRVGPLSSGGSSRPRFRRRRLDPLKVDDRGWVGMATVVGNCVPFVLTFHTIVGVLEVFIPVMGRSVTAVPADVFLGSLVGLMGALLSLVLLTPLQYLSQRSRRRAIDLLGLTAIGCVVYAVWRVKVPFTLGAPKRLLLTHFQRNFHAPNGTVDHSDAGMWLRSHDDDAFRSLTPTLPFLAPSPCSTPSVPPFALPSLPSDTPWTPELARNATCGASQDGDGDGDGDGALIRIPSSPRRDFFMWPFGFPNLFPHEHLTLLPAPHPFRNLSSDSTAGHLGTNGMSGGLVRVKDVPVEYSEQVPPLQLTWTQSHNVTSNVTRVWVSVRGSNRIGMALQAEGLQGWSFDEALPKARTNCHCHWIGFARGHGSEAIDFWVDVKDIDTVTISATSHHFNLITPPVAQLLDRLPPWVAPTPYTDQHAVWKIPLHTAAA